MERALDTRRRPRRARRPRGSSPLSAWASAVAPGLAAVAALVVCALLAAHALPAVSPLLWAVAFGIAAAPLVSGRSSAAAGVRLSSTWLLRAGVALIGLRVSAADLAAIGLHGVVVAVGAIAATMLLTIWLGRALGVPGPLGLLIATGSAICGASAIVAMSAAVDAEEEDVGYAMATITLFGSLAMLALPPLAGVLGLTDDQAGMWIGASVHEVAQVAAAGAAVSASALAIATLVKLARVVMLAPTVAAVAVGGSRPGGLARVPGFVLAFLLFVALRSLVDLPRELLDGALHLSTALLAAGLVALGLGVRLAPLRRAGLRPLALALAAAVIAATVALGLVALPL